MKSKNKNIIKILKILEKNFDSYERTTLNRMRKPENRDAFKVLIACLLSLRTQDKNTEIASKKLFAVADTPEQILKIPQKRLERLIYSSGHYKKKAQTIKNVSEILIKKHNSKVPKTKKELLDIRGIGPKTANIVLAFAFNEQVIPVDVHVHVISNRLGWAKTKKPEDTEKQLEKVIPKKFWRELNAILVLFGKEICITISPKCSQCPIKNYCPRINVKRSR